MPPPNPSTPHPARRALRPSRPAALTVLALVLSGCVSKGAYFDLLDEVQLLEESRDQLLAQGVAGQEAQQKARVEVEQLERLAADLDRRRALAVRRVEGLERQLEDLVVESEFLAAEQSTTEARSERATRALSELKGDYYHFDRAFRDLFYDELAEGHVEIEALGSGLRIRLADELLFARGSTHPTDATAELLARLAIILAPIRDRIEVEGHVDTTPIGAPSSPGRIGSWERAAARASAVARWLAAHGVAEGRLSVISYAEHRPIADNATREGRARNRRVEIRLMPERAALQQEGDPRVAGAAAPEAAGLPAVSAPGGR